MKWLFSAISLVFQSGKSTELIAGNSTLKYFRNALTRMTDLMTMPLAYITKIYTVFQNISVVFAMLILGEQLSTRK